MAEPYHEVIASKQDEDGRMIVCERVPVPNKRSIPGRSRVYLFEPRSSDPRAVQKEALAMARRLAGPPEPYNHPGEHEKEGLKFYREINRG